MPDTYIDMTSTMVQASHMLPLGYMCKRVVPRPDWSANTRCEDVCSISPCSACRDFADFVPCWKHNGFWLFDKPEAIRAVSDELEADLTGTTLFYYEAFNKQFDDFKKTWESFEPEPSFPTQVQPPRRAALKGYDVVMIEFHGQISHSPLSCYDLGTQVTTNRHCLFQTFDEARTMLENGRQSAVQQIQGACFRIIAVYETEWQPGAEENLGSPA